MLVQATEWLRENKGQSITEMSKGLGISSRLILQWVRHKRITLSEKEGAIPCKKCGEMIFSGTLCNRCKITLSHDLQQGLRMIKESDSLSASYQEEEKGMHYSPIKRDRRA